MPENAWPEPDPAADTFVGHVRRHHRDPFGYCKWVCEMLMRKPAPHELEVLPPANWIKATTKPPLPHT